MKKLNGKALSLALVLSWGTTLAPSFAEATPYVEQDTQKIVEGAQAVAYRARQVIVATLDISDTVSDANIDKANRLARQIQIDALAITDLLQKGAASNDVFDRLNGLESLVLQLDATKRQLQDSFGQERDLIDSLNAVRRTYFYLKQLLTGVAGR